MSESESNWRELAVAIILTTLVQALVSVTTFTPALLAPAAQADIGIAASSIGVFMAVMYFAASICAPMGGALVARYGPLRVSQHSLLWSGGGILLFATASPLLVGAGALLLGIGYGPITPASSTILSGRMPDRLRNVVMSVRQSGVPIGGALAGALVPSLLVAYGWRTAALIVAGSCMVLVLVLQPWRQRYDHGRRAAQEVKRTSLLVPLRLVVGYAPLRRLALVSFTYAGAQMCFASYLAVFLTERAGMSLVVAGAVFSTAMLGGVVGRIVWGLIADVAGNASAVLGLLGIVMGGSMLVLTQVNGQWPYAAVVVLCVALGASAIGWNGVYVAELARVAPDGRIAQATGGALAMTYFGVVVTPFVFWLIVTLSASYAIAFGAVGAVTLFAGASNLFGTRKATPA